MLTMIVLGTGKTTTARKMGQVFFDMGFLSEVAVLECSASDLIGSYVGQTGPKTRSQLEKALGKVLFVDEAYRLAEGQFAAEAVNELVDLLTKSTFMDKIVVILAGYDKDINNLIAVNPGLSSRFPEQIVFKDMRPEHCLEVLNRSIEEQQIRTPPLTNRDSQVHLDMIGLLKQLGSLPSWGNARDIKSLAKTMIGSVFRTQSSPTGALAISAEDVLYHTKVMLQERQNRGFALPLTERRDPSNQFQGLTALPPAPPHRLPSAITTTQVTKIPETQKEKLVAPEIQIEESCRDAGVPDDVWLQLQADSEATKAESTISDAAISQQEEEFRAMVTRENEKIATLKQIVQAQADDEAEVQEVKRKQEEARRGERAAREVREKTKEKLERMRLQMVRQKREEQVQVKLQQMGVCCVGYQWIKQAEGYRCAGGSHYVTNGRLGL